MASIFGKNVSRQSELAAKQAQKSEEALNQQGDVFAQQYNAALPNLTAAQAYDLQRAGLIDIGPNGEIIPIGLGTPQTRAAMVTNPNVNGGKPFAAYGSRINLPGNTVVAPAGTQTAPSFQERMDAQVLGIYNSPEYQLLRQSAQEDINRNMVSTGRNLGNQLTSRGLQNSSLMAGGQAGVNAAANKSYSDFNRQLALNAANKQDLLVNQALQSLNPSLAAGQQAVGAYGTGGSLSNTGIGTNQAVKAQQGSQLSNAIGGAANFAAQYYGVGGGGAGKGGAGGGGGGGYTLPEGQYGTDWGIDPNGNTFTMAHGGPVQAGNTYLTGEEGPETFVAGNHQQRISELLHRFADMIDKHMSHNKPQTMTHRNMGGGLKAGQSSVVGESGPEIFTPQQDGTILPNPNTATGLHPNINSVLQYVLSQGQV